MAVPTTTVTDTFQQLLAGEPIPSLPNWHGEWDLRSYSVEMERYNRQLLDYIRRLMARVVQAINTTGGGGGDTTVAANVGAGQGHVLVLGSNVTAKTLKQGAGIIISETATEITITNDVENVFDVVDAVDDWRYNTTTHKFEIHQVRFGAVNPTELGWTETEDGQPVKSTTVENVAYDTSTHEFTEDKYDFYALEPTVPETSVIVDLVNCNLS